MDKLSIIDPAVAAIIAQEEQRQEDSINLIASENYTDPAVLATTASVLTNKYAEGYPGKRYYAGCQYADAVEQLAIDRAKHLFGADHANVQPHAGSQANMAVFFATLKPGDTILGMSLAAGGHLTHGHHVNFSGQVYKSVSYLVNPDTELIDYDEVERLAHEHRPKLIIAGASAYSRTIDFARFGAIARSVGAIFLADIAHIAGLVAAGLHPTPVGHAPFITSTTHKTLRGPRGGLILCDAAYAEQLDRAIIPGCQGGPLMHTIAAKAVAFGLALEPSFAVYQRQIIKNAQALARSLQNLGYRIVAGGTDNHLLVVDLTSKEITGREAEVALERVGITASRSCIPYDKQKPWVTSGIRFGTPALTTRGMGEKEMTQIAHLIDETIQQYKHDALLRGIRQEVTKLAHHFPIKRARMVNKQVLHTQHLL